MEWAYGVTTVPERRETTLPNTIQSLALAGFDNPRLFVDGWDGRGDLYRMKGPNGDYLSITSRQPKALPFVSWLMALTELWLRHPKAQRFALFQDDIVTYRNLRTYLEKVPYPTRGYCNLYTAFKLNEPVVAGKPPGWYPAAPMSQDDKRIPKYQGGKGALGLIFSDEAVGLLLQERCLWTKHQSADKRIATKRIDGGIVTAMNGIGWQEFIHAPSLVQHTGLTSSCGNKDQPLALSFRGEKYDALDLLPT